MIGLPRFLGISVVSMLKLQQHDALPCPTRDQEARQDYVHDLRRTLAGMQGDLATLYRERVEPDFKREHGRVPDSSREVRVAMCDNADYQFWSASQRCSQELGWESVIDTVEQFGVPGNVSDPSGSLILNPDLPVPKYHTAQDIHIQPGGYHGGDTPDPIAAGAVFDLGVRIWGTGGMGPQNDILGVIASNYFASQYPDLEPKRILDMGCTIGGSTLPWKRKFPDAEVFAIDVAGPCLAYGHRRAEALGQTIHFQQQNAEETTFEDESFDVVVSHILLHETSSKALPRIFSEAYRLLKPGGITLHFDASPSTGEDPFMDFLYEWEVLNNNEAFLGTLRRLDVPSLLAQSGFDADKVGMIWAPGPSKEDAESEGYISFSALPAYIGWK